MKNMRRKMSQNPLIGLTLGIVLLPFTVLWCGIDWAISKRWKKYPSLYKVEYIMDLGNPDSENPKTATQVDGKWVPARSEGYASLRHRISVAWEVFTGKADAIRWPGGQ